MSISSKLTIVMGEIDIYYIYDTISYQYQYTGTTHWTHHIQAKIILRVRRVRDSDWLVKSHRDEALRKNIYFKFYCVVSVDTDTRQFRSDQYRLPGRLFRTPWSGNSLEKISQHENRVSSRWNSIYISLKFVWNFFFIGSIYLQGRIRFPPFQIHRC